jgi:AraC family transcriptional regulator
MTPHLLPEIAFPLERDVSAASATARSHVPRIELIVDGRRQPLCAPRRVLMHSGRFWRGYRLEWIRTPRSGILSQVSTPEHRVVFAVSGTCDVRYRAYLQEGRHRLRPRMFCFIARGYLFEYLAWTSSRFEAIIVDITDFGAGPSPVDAFGRTDALFDMYMGIEDTRVAALIDLMRAEIQAGCPTGDTYGEGLSVALASRVASLCATIPGERRCAPGLSSTQLRRVTDHVGQHLSHELTIDRLAAQVSMSPFHFARCFKQTTGMTPHQFVTRERVLRARELLTTQRRPIGDIAMELGFASQSHFSDVYRRITGSSPRQDRSGT